MLKVCTNCGFTWDEISSNNLVGCTICYEVFAEEIKNRFNVWHIPLIPLQSSGKPTGVPAPEQDTFARISDLREKLSKALLRENFKEAGDLKKEITRLEG